MQILSNHIGIPNEMLTRAFIISSLFPRSVAKISASRFVKQNGGEPRSTGTATGNPMFQNPKSKFQTHVAKLRARLETPNHKSKIINFLDLPALECLSRGPYLGVSAFGEISLAAMRRGGKLGTAIPAPCPSERSGHASHALWRGPNLFALCATSCRLCLLRLVRLMLAKVATLAQTGQQVRILPNNTYMSRKI